MTETQYKLARRQTDHALVIFDEEGQELIALPERVRAEFGEAILTAVNAAHAAGAKATRERIQAASAKAIEDYRQSLWGVDISLREPVPARSTVDFEAMHAARTNEQKLHDHLTGAHGYDPAALTGTTFTDLMLIHESQPAPHHHSGEEA